MTTELASASLKQGICVDMAVGSSAESITDTQTSRPPNSSCSNHEDSCFGLPYEDHNYGAPPRPPTPPLSPDSAFITHGLNRENSFKQIISNAHKMCIEKPVPATTTIYSEKGLLNPNGLLKVDVISEKNGSFRHNSIHSEPSRDVTRCICGISHDRGRMISCDQCKVWQHIDCVAIDPDHIPDTYLCDRCNPRALNKGNRMSIQAKRRDTSEVDSSDLESEEEKNCSKVSYTSNLSTPTSLTITSNRSAKKSESVHLHRKRKLCKDEGKRLGKRAHTNERKRSRSASKSSCTDGIDDDGVGVFTWARNLKEWSESYRVTDSNIYTPELLQAVLSSSHKSNEANKQESIIVKLQSQLAKVQQLRNRVMVMEDICISKPVVEVLGSYMLSNQSEANYDSICKRPYPYMFFYTGFDGLEVTVDSRTFGNISRYVRRSCCPNCEVRHVMEDNKLHLFVYSKENICNGSEITIPFDFKYQNCRYNVECGCGKFKDCPVYKFTNMRIDREEKDKSKQHKRRDDELGKVSPLRVSLSRIHEHMNGYSSSDHEVSNAVDCEEDDNHQNRRKKSREDRKMEAYVRAFERMEKKEKKKELLHQSQSTMLDEKGQHKDNVILETNSPLNSALQNASSKSPMTINGNSSTLLAVTPLRRPNRRTKSSRGNRRNSKRSRGASFEGVLSPSLSNDSNHSLDSSVMLDTTNTNSLQSLPPLTIESVSDSIFCSEASIPSHSSINSPVITQNNDTSVDFVGNSFSKSMIPHESTANSSQTELCENTENSLQSNGANEVKVPMNFTHSALVTNREITTGIDKEKKDSFLNETSSASAFACKTIKKKLTSSVDTLPVANANTELSNSSSQMQTSEVINKCTFKHWNFRPGVPSGQVHIGVGTRLKKRYFSDLYTKKIWLKMATDENLLTFVENQSDHSDTKSISSCDSKYSIGFKKSFLKTFSSTSITDLQPSGATVQSTVLSEVSKESLLPEECTDGNNDSADFPLDSLPSLQETKLLHQQFNPVCSTTVTASASLSTTTVSMPPTADNSTASAALPAIQYENISEDETDDHNSNADNSVFAESPLDSEVIIEVSKASSLNQDLAPVQPRMNGDIQPNRASYISSLSFHDEVACKLDQPSVMEDSQSAPTKKKVSLQEYLKRSKESRKSISLDQTTHNSTKATVISSDSRLTSVSAETKSVRSNSMPSSTTLLSADCSQITSHSTSTTTSTSTSSTSSESKKSEPLGKDIESLAKILSEVAKSAKNNDLTHTEHLNKLTSVLSSERSSHVMEVVNEYMKKCSAVSNASSAQNAQPSVSTAVEAKVSNSEKNAQDLKTSGSSKVPSETTTNNFVRSSTRPHVERSNSSPGMRHSHRSSGNIVPSRKKKAAESHPNSPSTKHQTSLNSSLHRKEFTSPVSASSHPPRAQPLRSSSPLPSTVYDHRHRSEYSSRDHNEPTRSRHNSNVSNEGSTSHSVKSPRHVFSESGPAHYNSKHSSITGHSLSEDYKQNRLHEPPQKAPSLPSPVQGQPIPSIIRGSRVPQTVYDRRSPRLEGGSPRWDLQRDPPGRSLKDVSYSRPDTYYSPRPHSPPNNSSYDYNRSSYDKHYDRYPPRLSRCHDDHIPSKTNLPPAPYHQYSHYPPPIPPNYRDDRPSYYPSRDSRPPSPGPPRHNPYGYRSSHYPPPDHYRR